MFYDGGCYQERLLNKKLKYAAFVFAISFLLISVYLLAVSYQKAQAQPCVFPSNTVLVNVAVGGLTSAEAQERIQAIYALPFVMQTGDDHFTLDPVDVGFSIEPNKIVSDALIACENQSAWDKFNAFIWQKPATFPISADLAWNLNPQQLQAFLQTEILPRYEIPGSPAYPLSGTTQFVSGKAGKMIDRALLQERLIDGYLSPKERSIDIPYVDQTTYSLTEAMLLYQLEQALIGQNYRGLVELQAERLSDGAVFSFAYQNLQPIQPGVAFTAASTMKIPILLSSLSRSELPLSDLQQGWVNYMLIYSENDPADRLMEGIDLVRGPLVVTQDMQESLGLENTFIAGYFYLGAPLLDLVQTPANQRMDININADLYNQTTAADIRALLSMLYECEQHGSGALVSKLGEGMTQEKCQLAVETLKRNQMGALIESGLPEAIPIAHKHGWSEEKDGLVHTFSDVGIVYAPENDFVLTIFIYSPDQLLFDTANVLTAQLSQAVYNFMNPNYQVGWQFGD